MKSLAIFLLIAFYGNIASAQYAFTPQQQYMVNEWRDAYGGQIYACT